MRKGIRSVIAALAAASTLASTFTVMAVPAGYTGWSTETGAARYYENGVMAVNKWVRNGSNYYLVGPDGLVIPNRVVCVSDISETYIAQLDPQNAAAQAAAVPKTITPAPVAKAAKTVAPVNVTATPATVNAANMQALIAAQQKAARDQLAALAAASQAQQQAAAKAAQAQAAAAALAQKQALAAAKAAQTELTAIIAAQQAANAAQAAQAQAAAKAAQAAAVAGVSTGATADQVRAGQKQASEITSDFEAFKYLHPEIVSTYGNDLTGLYGKYMSTYSGGSAGGVYLATIARLYAINGNTPHYNQSYEDLHNGTHKAYTGSGDWIIESCDDYKHNSEGYRKCSKCGHVFKHTKLKDFQ